MNRDVGIAVSLWGNATPTADSSACNLNSTAQRLHDGGIPATLAINLPVFALLFAWFCFLHRRSSSSSEGSATEPAAAVSTRTPLLQSATTTTATAAPAGDKSKTKKKKKSQHSVGGRRASYKRLQSYDETGQDTGLLHASSTDDVPGAADDDADEGGNENGGGQANGGAQALTTDDSDMDSDDNADDPVLNADAAHFFHPHGWFAWIGPLLKLTDADMCKTAGIDAVHYLVFQRLLFFVTLAMSVLSIAVVLPINYTGSEDYEGFAATTISNIPSGSLNLWAHVVFTGVFSFGIYYTLSRYNGWVQRTHRQWRVETHDTLMIANIPIEIGDATIIKQHFGWAYPEAVVRDVRLAYDVREISSLFRQLRHARHALEHERGVWQRDSNSRGPPPTTRVPWAICGTEVNAVEYYTEQVRALQARIDACKQALEGSPAGIAFVTFAAPEMASAIVAQHRAGWPKHSMHSSLLRPASWFVELAPAPSDIHWSALTVGSFAWYLRFLVINALLLLFLLFFTTPISLLSSLKRLSATDTFSGVSDSISHSAFLTNYLPTLLLFVFALLLPLLIYYSTALERHRTRTEMHLSLARKLFIYLVMSVLILPGFVLTSADAFIEITLRSNESLVDKIECVFLPDNGALFVNYMLMVSLLGVPIGLLNIWPFLVFKWRVWRAVTAGELARAQRAAKQTFSYGEEYARLAAMFCVVLVFSTTCPIITLVGVVYFGLKHVSDKYMLCFVHEPTFTSDGRLVKAAINFVLASVVLFEAIVLGFYVLKVGMSSGLSITLLLFLEVTIVLLGLKFFGVSCYPLVGFRPPSQQDQQEAPSWRHGHDTPADAAAVTIASNEPASDTASQVDADAIEDFNVDLAFAASDDEEDYLEQQQRKQARRLEEAARRHAQEQAQQEALATAHTRREPRRPYLPPFMLDWDDKGRIVQSYNGDEVVPAAIRRRSSVGADLNAAGTSAAAAAAGVEPPVINPLAAIPPSPIVVARDDLRADTHELLRTSSASSASRS